MEKTFKIPFLLVLFSIAFFFSNKAAYTQSRIYGITNDLVYFDYLTGEYLTVPGYSISPQNTSFGCTIDPFNGRYFFKTHPVYEQSIVTCLSLDTIQESFTPLFENPDLIEYNCLNNTLIFQAKDGGFWSYNIGSRILNKLSTLLPSTGTVYGQTTTYYPLKNQYFHQRYYNGVLYFDVIDGFTGKMISSHPSPYGFIAETIVDLNTGIYYGILNDSVIQFDPISNEKSSLVSLNQSFVLLNSQMATFDQNLSNYIIPVYNSNTSQANYIIVNVQKKIIDTIILQPNKAVNWQQIYSKPTSLLIQLGDSLICSHGISYTWFYNNDTIHNCNSNSFKPHKSGKYKVKVQYTTYTSTSKEIFFNFSNISEITNNEFNLFPNPVHDKLNIHLNNKDFANVNIKIYDIHGNVVLMVKPISETTVVSTNRFKNGVYVVRLEALNSIVQQKFIKY